MKKKGKKKEESGTQIKHEIVDYRMWRFVRI